MGEMAAEAEAISEVIDLFVGLRDSVSDDTFDSVN